MVEKEESHKKCYGCGRPFADKYNSPPNNLIIRHVDRRIMGKDDATTQLVFNHNFTAAYYHANKMHIVMKNPNFAGIVNIKNSLYAKIGQERANKFSTSSELLLNFVNWNYRGWLNTCYIFCLDTLCELGSQGDAAPIFVVRAGRAHRLAIQQQLCFLRTLSFFLIYNWATLGCQINAPFIKFWLFQFSPVNYNTYQIHFNWFCN